MCRLFGFRSIFSNQIHKSLIHADNALVQQSEMHPDGWGVAYYVANSPHIIKSSDSAFADQLFQHVSGIVSSETVIAHLRKSTQGSHNTLNTHPFQFGGWVFAHNGNIKNFRQHRQALIKLINEPLQRFLLGDTDSEVFFYLVISELSKLTNPHQPNIAKEIVESAIKNTLQRIVSLVGDFFSHDDGPETETYLTFILTNGRAMYGVQAGKKLYYSTHKKRCSERDSCPHYFPSCERPVTSGKISHLLFSSEPLSGENEWVEMSNGQLIAVDSEMQFFTSQL